MELLPGDEFECTAKYTLSQDDVDSGEREDQVSISGVARDMNSTEVRGSSIHGVITANLATMRKAVLGSNWYVVREIWEGSNDVLGALRLS